MYIKNWEHHLLAHFYRIMVDFIENCQKLPFPVLLIVTSQQPELILFITFIHREHFLMLLTPLFGNICRLTLLGCFHACNVIIITTCKATLIDTLVYYHIQLQGQVKNNEANV